MGVVGSISIKDAASSVLRNIRQEQAALKKETAGVREELKRTWDKTYTAKIDASVSGRKVDTLTGKVKEFAKQKAAPVIAVKDAATAKVQKIKSGMHTVDRKVISPIIKLKDAASNKMASVTSKLKAVGSKIASPIVKVKDATGKGISAIGGKIKSLGKAVVIPVAIAATTAATAIMGGAVSQGAKLEQSIGGVVTLFKDDAGVVKANAASAFKTVGLSAHEYMEQVTSFSASLLNSLGGDTATAAKVADMAMIDMADNANKFGTDMDSIQNAYQGFAKQNYTMLDNLKLGYGGTKEEMQRLLGDATKLTGVKYNIDNLSDVYNAIHAIQDNLGVAGTTAKEASSTFSGSFAAMKSAAKNVLGNLAIGGDVTGSMEQLVDSASTFLLGNAVPMVGRVISALPKAIKTGIKNAAPKIKASGGEIIKSLRTGILDILPPSLGGITSQIFDSIGDVGVGFVAVIPHLTAFGFRMMATMQQVSTAVIPMITSIVSTITTMLPVILPVIQTVVSTLGNIFAQGAPVISGLVSGIGTVVTALAPVFGEIFSAIGDKVGTVLSFVGERMGFIQAVIATVAPLVGDIISTAWGVISPIMDLTISVFKILFSVVQKVFPGIKTVIEGVWNVIKPILEGIGSVIGGIAEWFGTFANAVSVDTSGKGTKVGKNAAGDNNWRGGLTWVGEQGPELIDLPRGSRILPHKESVTMASAAPVIKNDATNLQQNIVTKGSMDLSPITKLLSSIDSTLRILTDRFQSQGLELPQATSGTGTKGFMRSITVQIAKLADQIIVKEQADIDDVSDKVAKKIIEVVVNMG